MGGHDHGIPKVPDWRMYKIDGIREMKKVQDRLAKHGLKDPWLRNDVWRFNPLIGTGLGRMCTTLFRGLLRVGLPAFLVTVAVKELVLKEKDDHHAEHH